MTGSARRILVVDDDEDIRLLCAAVLKRAGYEVDMAVDGDDGWRALEAVNHRYRRYDLLITDNNMPKLSGLELIGKLRAAQMALPVILSSGQFPAAIDAAMASNTPIQRQDWNSSLQIAALLPKPFTIEQLLGTVNRVLLMVESAGVIAKRKKARG